MTDRTPRVDDVVLAEIVERMGQEYESVCATYGADHVQPPAHYLIARELLALRAQNETLAAIVRDVAAMNLEDVYICPACGFETSYRNLPEEHDGPCPYRRAVAWAREAGETR